jgi:serine protease Do
MITLMALGCVMLPLAAPAPGGQDDFPFIVMNGNNTNTWLGVRVRDLKSAELDAISSMDDLGVYVNEVLEDSPAEKAGVREGDIIVRFAGIPVLGAEHFIRLIQSSAPGRTFSMELWHDSKTRTVQVTLAEHPQRNAFRYRVSPESITPERSRPSLPRFYDFFSFRDRPRLGIYYEDITEQLARFLGVDEGTGVLITSVIEDSPAEKAGLQAGDVIIRIGDQTVKDSGDLMEALQDRDADESLPVTVIRKGDRLDFEVVMGKEDKPAHRGRLSL